jgi:uncharacterized Zn finger protein
MTPTNNIEPTDEDRCPSCGICEDADEIIYDVTRLFAVYRCRSCGGHWEEDL